ncbi:Auxilliary activities family 12 protein [Periconia macrospinosa]|uniref:Auxilliary activities family 12 protein n=1 Tax=Periconia macrospinosa TaxID=97972 RepID=A0A2V1DLQ5_9PLEO|nr:Auxilliary activities family 12 protein [Periconia macrospinosa]
MLSFWFLGSAAALASYAFAQGEVQSKVVCDAATKICYSTYTQTEIDITYGIALPKNATDPYDAIIKITAPADKKWVGFAWGGQMVWDPLTVVWPNATSVVASARWAFSTGMPLGYEGAEHFLLKGSSSNSTHWTVNALCKGCTGWQSNEDERYALNATGTTQFAWAYGTTDVSTPQNNDSTFSVHAAVGHWNHDLNAARVDDFDSLVKSNLLTAPPVVTSAPTTARTTIVTSTTSSSTSAVVKATIPASCSGAGNPVFQGKLATGWKATKILGGLRSPRSIQFDTAGNMLVVQSGLGITYHVLGSDGCITSSKTLISLNSLNHGIALSPDGKTLYASSMTQAYSWPYDAAAATVGTRTTIMTGMVNGGSHLTRTLAVRPDQPNLLVVSHGSNSNIDTATSNPSTGRAIIKVFDLSKIPSGGFKYASDGYTAGYGQRNEVGMCFDNNNMLWGVENSGDDFRRTVNGQSTDVHQNNPGEKIHYMGDITKPNNNWYGYPSCFTVWQPSDFKDKTFKVGDWFVQAPNSTFNDDTCVQKATPPALTLFPHSAPIDCKFDPENANMFITYHGSWNRQPTTGFKLVAVPFKKGSDGAYVPVDPLTSTTAAKDIFYNPDVTKCAGNGPGLSSGCFRPAGLAYDKAGRLFMTSDTSSNGEIWILGQG